MSATLRIPEGVSRPRTSAPLARAATLLLLFAAAAGAQETVDFEALPQGTVVFEVFTRTGLGPIQVTGFNSRLGARNAAVIFDSGRPTGGDFDLGSPNASCPGGGPGQGAAGAADQESANCVALGHVLIVAERLRDRDGDGRVDDPDDEQVQPSDGSARLEFDFSRLGSVSIEELTVLDIETPTEVRLLDRNGDPIQTVPIAPTGDNGLRRERFEPNDGVVRVIVALTGSGAIDDLVFRPGPVEVPDLVGLSIEPAAARLRDRWLDLLPPESAPPYPLRVAAQRPAAGARVPIRTAVAIELAVEVPDLRGLAVEDARAELASRRLQPSLTDQIDERTDWFAHTVSSQEPGPGAFLPLGSTVALDLATAARVPSLLGLEPDEARERLAERRLGAEPAARELGTAPWVRYEVATQQPGPDDWVPVESAVSMTFSATVQVPDLAGLELGDARGRLGERKLVADLGDQQPRTEEGYAYRVGAQDPSPGAWAASGSAVALTLAGSVTVPDVRGLEFPAASRKLREWRLQAVADPPGFEPRAGVFATVRSQDPAAGASAPIGATVGLGLDVEVTVPGVQGRRLESARDRLARESLATELAGELPAPAPGVLLLVATQDPRPGSRIASGGAVRVTVREVVVVPEVRGLPLAEAQAELGRRRLVGALEGAPAEPPEDRSAAVERQSREPWTYAPIGAVVALGLGDPLVEVPWLRGLTTEQAQQRLREVGLVLSETPTYAEGSPLERVLSQSPAPRTRVERGRFIGVTMGRELPAPEPWRFPWWWLLLVLLLGVGLRELRRLRRVGYRIEASADLAGLRASARPLEEKPIHLDVRLQIRFDPGVQSLEVDGPLILER